MRLLITALQIMQDARKSAPIQGRGLPTAHVIMGTYHLATFVHQSTPVPRATAAAVRTVLFLALDPTLAPAMLVIYLRQGQCAPP